MSGFFSIKCNGTHWASLGLHILYKEIQLLHRDVSYGNIAFYKKGRKYYVVILDFDLAIFADRDNGASSNHCMGTAPFMSREVLNAIISSVEFTHHITHDLESLVDLSVWCHTGYKPRHYPAADPLKMWRKGTPLDMLEAKDTFYTTASRKILAHIENLSLRWEINKIRTAYMEERIADEIAVQAETPFTRTLMNRAHEEGRKAVQAFLQEHPSLDEDDWRVRKIYVTKVREIETSGGPSVRKKSVYRGISYKRICKAVGRRIKARHIGCRCC